jgi:hypothetical protein
VAVNFNVDEARAAAADAERLTCCGVPGARLKVDGEADTPDESPLVATLIVPVNPLRAVAESFTGCVLPPAVRATLDTFAETEKSGAATAAVTVTATDTLWLSFPDVAVNFTVEEVTVAAADAVRLTCCVAPGARLNVEGEALTPDESPLMVTLIVPVNPLRAVAESFTVCALPPAVRDKLDTFVETEKSGVLPVVPLVVTTPPQPMLNPPDRMIPRQQRRLFLTLDIRSAAPS